MIRKNLLRSLSVIMATMLAVMTVACGAVKTEDTEAAQETAQEAELEESLVSAAASSSRDSEAGKVETVYVTADANGAVNDVIVSEWLKNANAAAALSDTTELQNIVNVKGNETFTDNGDGTVTWNAGGSDIYYQGTTDKELPVSMKVTYTLDGKEISPADLAGKSGRVTIKFEYTNNCKQTVNVDGKDIEVYTPFAMVSGLMLDADKFSNVEISNGKVISDGGSYIVMGVATPGLKESLDLDEEKLDELEESGELETKLSDSFEVTADTTDFQLGMTITMASSDVLSDFGLSDVADSEKLDEVKEDMEDLNDGSTELVDGTKELKDGTTELRDGVGELYDGTQELADGTSTLYDGTQDLYDGVVTYTDGVSQVDNGAKALADGAKAAKEGADQLKNGMDEADLVNGANKLAEGSAQVSAGVSQLAQGLSTLPTMMQDLAKKDASYKAISAWLSSTDPNYSLSVPEGVDVETFGACLASLGLPSNVAYANAWRQGCLKSMYMLSKISDGTVTIAPPTTTTTTASTIPSEDSGENAVDVETGTVTNPANDNAGAGSDEGGNGNTGDNSGAGNNGGSGDEGGNGNTGDEGGSGNTGDEGGNGNTGDNSGNGNSASAGNSGSTGAGNGASDNDLDDDDLDDDDLDNEEEEDEEFETTSLDLSLLGDDLTSTGLEEKKVTVSAAPGYSAAEFSGYLTDAQNYYQVAGAAGGAYSAIHSVYAGLAGSDLAKLNAPANIAGQTILQILAEGAATVAEGNAKLAGGIQTIYNGAVALDSGLGDLSSGASQLYDGTQQLTSNNDALVSGAYDLSDGARQLNDGAGELNDGVSELNSGVVELDDGVQELLDGVVKLDEEGIKKLYEAFNGDLTDFTDRVQAVQEAGSNYKTFAGADEDVDSSVKFIIKTEAVEAKEM